MLKQSPVAAEAQRQFRAQQRSATAIWKLERGCVDCGYNTIPEALEFDHIADDKVNAVAILVNSHAPIESIIEEMEKCEVVCANCHRGRTVERARARRTGS